MSELQGSKPESPLAAWSGPILIAVAALAMLTWTWGTWPDVLVDFGDQCYIPWRLVEGQTLYRDIAFYNGPLSQYFNALCFRAFGVDLHTLVFCNLALLAGLIALLYYALRQVSRRFGATVACLVFVLLFAFAQYVGIGNYNYVCPYSHEATHGLMLSLLAIVLAWPSERYGLARAVGSGIALGLAFLTKAEVFLPGAVATLVAMTLGLAWQCHHWRRRAAQASCFLLAFLAPPLVAFASLALAMPAGQALLGTLGSWVVAVRSDLTALPFFREGTGMDHPLANLGKMIAMSGVYAVFLLPAAGLGFAIRRGHKYRLLVAAVVLVLAAVVLWQVRRHISWSAMARPFPLLIVLTLVAVVIAFLPHRHDPTARRRFTRQVSLLTFALLMLAKMILNTHIMHYGFVLAMPAAVLLAVAACDWVPGFIDRRGGNGWVFAAVAVAMFAVAGFGYGRLQSKWIAIKRHPIGSQRDRFLADDRAMLVGMLTSRIALQLPLDRTLAVLPEGCMINYLTRRRNSTPYIHLMPVEVKLFGEKPILAAFQARPPDMIALVDKDTSEFGFRYFGRDYAKQLGDWIAAHYQRTLLLGHAPFEGKGFGIALLVRKGERSLDFARRR